ncbi:Hypothetical predicted protein [Olea europaea subsp. europaea]|uniref:Uncharacterized protein n=1 Tax=Olea europaea subsp. europaea TaxID=158383 RepID=A0A8S0TDG1_OLEEU|nr:Hypothetical predicted protein [Olea europaea subsp. europaea]
MTNVANWFRSISWCWQEAVGLKWTEKFLEENKSPLECDKAKILTRSISRIRSIGTHLMPHSSGTQ